MFPKKSHDFQGSSCYESERGGCSRRISEAGILRPLEAGSVPSSHSASSGGIAFPFFRRGICVSMRARRGGRE